MSRICLTLLGFGLAALPVGSAWCAVLVEDAYNIAGNGSGFALNSGINSGIDPPTTRLAGSVAANLRYITTTTRSATAFSIAGNRLRVVPAANPGRFVLSADGSASFDFGPYVGIGTATPQHPAVYDLTISMANRSAGVQRFSFALSSAEGDATSWNFGLQLYRNTDAANFYIIGKRIDATSSGLASDLNAFITNTAPGTFGAELRFLVRITDAGPETSAFSSRVQVSMDGGFSWVYDTRTDASLPHGWRLNGTGRHVIWDVAPNAGEVTYDNFSLRRVLSFATPVEPAANALDLGPTAGLSAAVSNQAPGNLTVTFYGREAPKPYPGRDFAVAVLPDSQNYARESAGNGDAVKEMWFTQTEWLVTNSVAKNIAYVAHLGDIVQNGDIKNGNDNTAEWRNATNAMYRLENPSRTLLPHGLPYGLAAGNHDQEPIGDADGTTAHYNQYFGLSRFEGRPYYGGHYGSNNDSHFDFFSSGGLDFIVLYFEFGRYGSGILNWANAVLATNQHRRAIVVTHFAGSDSTPSHLSAQGSAIYNALRGNPNFFMMLGGHVFNNNGEGSRSNSYEGRTVRTFISNYQGRMNGGDGLMRLMYFSPTNNTVHIKTYSPWLDKYEMDANSQISFNYNLQLPGGPGSPGTPYVALATNTGVAAGALASCQWTGLQPRKAYDWYVAVEDNSGHVFNSAVSSFSTSSKFAPNALPVASNQIASVTGDAPVFLTLTGNDPEGDPLSFRITSQPVHGLVTDFDPSTGLLTYLPARGYRGAEWISFVVSDGMTNSGPGLVMLTVVAPPDTNFNGMADAWETAFGVTNPSDDDDQDGFDNLQEYLANTNPTNTLSALRFISVEREPTGEIGLVWASVGGTRYRVQFSDPDANGGPAGPFTDIPGFVYDEMDAAPYGEPSAQIFTDTSAPADRMRFYRVRVVP